MKQSITFCQFNDDFRDMGRDNHFSYDGLKTLYDYLEQYGEETGEEVELDVIALCCEFTEYQDIKEFQGDYGEEYEDIESIEYNTLVLPIDDEGFIVQDF